MSELNIKKLNAFLEDKSYLEGFHLSKADFVAFEALKDTPSSDYPHVLRWHKHIAARKADKVEDKAVDLASFGICGADDAAKNDDDDDDDDDDVDLFGSDEEDDEEAEKLKEQRLAEYRERKAKKPAVIAKSSITYDVKPWDDETDLAKMEEAVRGIEMDGLVWGASKLVPVGYGIKKLRILCVVEDDKVSSDVLEEKIRDFEDYVQSVDIENFSKI